LIDQLETHGEIAALKLDFAVRFHSVDSFLLFS